MLMTENYHVEGSQQGKRLRLDRDRAIFLGVCSGLARYLGVEAWIIRIITFILAMPLTGAVLLIYLVLWFVLKREDEYFIEEEERDEMSRRRRKSKRSRREHKSQRSSNTPRVMLHVAKTEFDHLEQRLRRIEKFVTSGQYELFQGFSDINR